MIIALSGRHCIVVVVTPQDVVKLALMAAYIGEPHWTAK